jgi:inorganic pyrophosphatase
MTLSQITHFFAHYKDLEAGKFVKVEGWGGPEEAKKEIAEGVKQFKKKARPK